MTEFFILKIILTFFCWFIYLLICLIYLFTYLFVYLFIYLFFIYFNNNRTQGVSFFIFCSTLCVRVSTVKSVCASICKYVFFFLYVSYLNFCQFLCLWVCLFVCLTTILLRWLYLLSIFTVLILWYNRYFHQSSPIIFYFIFSSVRWGRIQDIEFERYGLALPVRCMGTPFKVSINYFVLFILQRVVSVCFLSYP